jgi:hypothetical protein
VHGHLLEGSGVPLAKVQAYGAQPPGLTDARRCADALGVVQVEVTWPVSFDGALGRSPVRRRGRPLVAACQAECAASIPIAYAVFDLEWPEVAVGDGVEHVPGLPPAGLAVLVTRVLVEQLPAFPAAGRWRDGRHQELPPLFVGEIIVRLLHESAGSSSLHRDVLLSPRVREYPLLVAGDRKQNGQG